MFVVYIVVISPPVFLPLCLVLLPVTTAPQRWPITVEPNQSNPVFLAQWIPWQKDWVNNEHVTQLSPVRSKDKVTEEFWRSYFLSFLEKENVFRSQIFLFLEDVEVNTRIAVAILPP